MPRLFAGAPYHDLGVLRAALRGPTLEARIWAAAMLPWDPNRSEDAAALAVEALNDLSLDVRETALTALVSLAPRLVRALSAEHQEVLLAHLDQRVPPGDPRAILIARYVFPDRGAQLLRGHLQRARRSGGLRPSLLEESVHWSLDQVDGELLCAALDTLPHFASLGDEHFELATLLASAAMALDEGGAARPLLAAVTEGLAAEEPMPVYAAILLLLINHLGLGATEQPDPSGLREMIAPRPKFVRRWLGTALDRLGQAGVEVRGLRKQATDGRWAPVLRALLEDIDDLIDDAPAGSRLAAALMEELEERRIAGSLPPAMMPWACLLAAAARLRMLRVNGGAADLPQPRPRLDWDAELDPVLDALSQPRMSRTERQGLVVRALRLAGLPATEQAGDARAIERIRQCAELIESDGNSDLARAALLLRAGIGDERGLNAVRSILRAPAADPTELEAAQEAVGMRLDLLGATVEELFGAAEPWQLARALGVLAQTPTYQGLAEPLAERWQELVRVDMPALLAVAFRVPDARIAALLREEAGSVSTRATHHALLVSAVSGAAEDELEELRLLLGQAEQLAAGAQLSLEMSCVACGRIASFPVSHVLFDPPRLESSAGREGMLPGPELTCPHCAAQDEMQLLPSAALRALSESDRIELRQVELSDAQGEAIKTVRSFLDAGFDPDSAASARSRSRRLYALGRVDAALRALDGDEDAEAELIRAMMYLDRSKPEQAKQAIERARARMTPQTDPALAAQADELETGLRTVMQVLDPDAADLQDEPETKLAGAPSRRETRPRRNDPCPCGSGRKYKQCCLAR